VLNLKAALHFAASVTVLVVSLLSSVQLMKLTHVSADEDTLYLRRFDAIRSTLPKRGVVCYVPSPDDSFDAKKHYFLAQYALAPLVVRTTPDCEPLIGDFPTADIPASVCGSQFSVLQDFGNGLLLLRRNTCQ
jgi:hypothetical protein